MKVLKGLVLTMLVSTATIFSMDASSNGDQLTTDGLTIDQTVAKTTVPGIVEGCLVIGADGSVIHDHGIAGSIILENTVGQTSIALSSTEVAAITLTRLANNDSLDENTSSVISTVLNLLGTDTSSAIEILQGLTSSGNAFTGSGGSTIQDVLDVLTSEVAGTQVSTLSDLTTDEATRIEFSRLVSDFKTKFSTFDISDASVSIEQLATAKVSVTGAYDALSYVLGSATSELIDSSGSVIEETDEISKATRIDFSDLVSDFTVKLNTFNPFTIAATTDLFSSLTVSVAGAYDALSELVDSTSSALELADSDDAAGGVVDDLSSSVMGLGLGAGGLQRHITGVVAADEVVDEGSNTDKGDLS